MSVASQLLSSESFNFVRAVKVVLMAHKLIFQDWHHLRAAHRTLSPVIDVIAFKVGSDAKMDVQEWLIDAAVGVWQDRPREARPGPPWFDLQTWRNQGLVDRGSRATQKGAFPPKATQATKPAGRCQHGQSGRRCQWGLGHPHLEVAK